MGLCFFKINNRVIESQHQHILLTLIFRIGAKNLGKRKFMFESSEIQRSSVYEK